MRERSIIIVVLASVFSIGFVCYFYVGAEQPVYTWDYGGYWRIYQRYAGLAISGNHWLHEVLLSIRKDDYNPAATIPLIPVFYVFGGARLPYVISIAICYLVPTVILTTIVATSTSRINHAFEKIAVFLIAITFPAYWAPTFRGMIDIIGLIPLGIATLLVLRSNFLAQDAIKTGIAVGFALWVAFLFRRWYAYSIVSFGFVSFCFGLFIRRHDKDLLKSFLVLVSAWAAAGVAIIGLALLLQYDLVLRIISTNYSDLYSSYQVPLVEHFEMFFSRLGAYVLVLMCIGIANALFTEKKEVLFCALCAVVTFALFIRTQEMRWHHFLPVAFWLFPSYVEGITTASRRIKILPEAIRTIPFLLISGVMFIFCFFPIFGRQDISDSVVFPKTTYPLRLDRFDEYIKMIADLKRRMDPRDKLAVYASSDLLSDELLGVLDPALDSHFIRAQHNAKRDLFSFEILRAQYAIAVDPPQTHQAPHSQENITIPDLMLLNGQDIGAAYEKTNLSYKLADGITAYVFRRKRDVTLAEMQLLIEAFAQYYPSWPQKFKASMSVALAARQETLGDVYGRASATKSELHVHPGVHSPTTVSIPLIADARPASMKISIAPLSPKKCPTADGITADIAIDGVRIDQVDVLPGTAKQLALPAHGDALSISISKRNTINCDTTTVSFGF